jgi:hypothetical protein
LPFLTTSKQEITIATGQKIVVMMNIIKDKNLSSGEDVGERREKVNQLVKKYAVISK